MLRTSPHESRVGYNDRSLSPSYAAQEEEKTNSYHPSYFGGHGNLGKKGTFGFQGLAKEAGRAAKGILPFKENLGRTLLVDRNQPIFFQKRATNGVIYSFSLLIHLLTL